MMNTKDTTERLIRLAVRLQDSDIVVEYKQGKTNSNANAMSRIPSEKKKVFEIIIEKTKDMLHAQKEDKEIQDIKEYIETGNLPNELRKLLGKSKRNYIIEDEYIKFIEEKDRLIIVPKEKREKLLYQYK